MKKKTSFYIDNETMKRLKKHIPNYKISNVLEELSKDEIILKVLVDRAIHQQKT